LKKTEAKNNDETNWAVMTSSNEKGNALERAVAAIERHVLSTSPDLAKNTFIIENKKIISVGGVHHEIDIFVTIDSAPGYKSVFLFECKNLVDAVSKNDIIIFAEKIDAAHAQHGYFVAKSFTKDAEAQASKDARITLLLATEHNEGLVPIPLDLLNLHCIHPQFDSVHVEFRRVGSAGGESIPLDLTATNALVNGTPAGLKDYVVDWAKAACAENTRTFNSAILPDGTYERECTSTREFGPNDLMIGNDAMERGTISFKIKVQVFRPRLESRFEVESRGHYYLLQPFEIEGTSLQMGIAVSGR